MQRFNFLGYPVDRITLNDSLRWIAQKATCTQPHRITVLNANKLWLAGRETKLAGIIRASDLVLPEYAVVWGAARLGLPALSPVYGVALVQAFLPYAEQHGLRPFFLGARLEVVETLQEQLKTRYPRLEIAGRHHGYLREKEVEQSAIAAVRQAKPDILFIGMGSPRQEYWIDAHKEVLGVPVLMGVGGTFDVLSGAKADTPAWIRGTGFEWLYRLAIQPKQYWRRYAITNPWFLLQVLKESIKK